MRKKRAKVNRSIDDHELLKIFQSVIPDEKSCRKAIYEARRALNFLQKNDTGFLGPEFTNFKWEEDL